MINDTNTITNTNTNTNSNSNNSNNSNNSTAVYQPYSGNDPMILAQKNAANIQFLKEKMADLQKLESSFNSLDTKIDTNTTNIKKMAQYATNRITQTTGISPTGGIPSSLSELSTIKPEELDTTTN
jgi:uncharacterized protein YdcH (DUF465 family)